VDEWRELEATVAQASPPETPTKKGRSRAASALSMSAWGIVGLISLASAGVTGGPAELVEEMSMQPSNAIDHGIGEIRMGIPPGLGNEPDDPQK
jgi:hypothetical protein